MIWFLEVDRNKTVRKHSLCFELRYMIKPSWLLSFFNFFIENINQRFEMSQLVLELFTLHILLNFRLSLWWLWLMFVLVKFGRLQLFLSQQCPQLSFWWTSLALIFLTLENFVFSFYVMLKNPVSSLAIFKLSVKDDNKCHVLYSLKISGLIFFKKFLYV